MSETWRAVVGFEENYEVSDHGNVRTVRRWRRNRYSGYWREPQPVTRHRMRSGHFRVYLYPPSQPTKHEGCLVHRLVLTAFVGECPADKEGCHRDGDPANNHVSNLYWGTKSENQLDSIRHGTHNSFAKAQRTHCRRGHEYTPENTYLVPPDRTARRCKTCVQERLDAQKMAVAR